MKYIAFIVFLLATHMIVGQEDIKEYSIEKGEVLDVLFVRTKPDTKEAFASYKNDIFKLALEYTVQFLPGFQVSKIIYGNNQPTSLVIVKWADKERRESFLVEVEKEIKDFHERRQSIWSIFKLAYFPHRSAKKYVVDNSAYNVAFSLWGTDEDVERYMKKYGESMEKYNGSIPISLTDGISPFRYRFDADVFFVSSWKDKETFDAFFQGVSDFEKYGLTDAQVYELK